MNTFCFLLSFSRQRWFSRENVMGANAHQQTNSTYTDISVVDEHTQSWQDLGIKIKKKSFDGKNLQDSHVDNKGNFTAVTSPTCISLFIPALKINTMTLPIIYQVGWSTDGALTLSVKHQLVNTSLLGFRRNILSSIQSQIKLMNK